MTKKPYNQTHLLGVYMPENLWCWIRDSAAIEKRSISQWINIHFEKERSNEQAKTSKNRR